MQFATFIVYTKPSAITMGSTPDKHLYLQSLRRGDEALIVVKPGLSSNARNDFDRYKAFLAANGRPSPTPSDLYVVVERNELLKLLTYALDRNCLGLQYCFGFNGPLRQGGRFVFVNKGAIVDRRCDDCDLNACEELIYKSDFQVRDADSPNWYTPHFLNFRLSHELPPDLADVYIDYFGSIYKHYHTHSKPPLTGSVLPVKRLLSILTDAGSPLGTTELLTFRWGITDYESEDRDKPRLGKFSVAIGIGDLSQGPVIERRSVTDKEITEDLSDCPPRKPCGKS